MCRGIVAFAESQDTSEGTVGYGELARVMDALEAGKAKSVEQTLDDALRFNVQSTRMKLVGEGVERQDIEVRFFVCFACRVE